MFENKDIIIKKSSIQGTGLFANRDFKKGEIITHWNVKGSFTREEATGLPPEQKKRLSFAGNDKYGIVSEPACFVNHSCTPNTNSINQTDVASREIKKGEEITADYTSDEDTTFITFNCKCGSKNCKGKVS